MFLCDGLILTHISVDVDVCSFCETFVLPRTTLWAFKGNCHWGWEITTRPDPSPNLPILLAKNTQCAWSSWSSWSLCSSWSSGQTGLIDRTHGTDRRQVREDRQICHLNLIFQVTCVRTAFAILAMFFWRFPLHYTLWPDWWRIVRPLPGIESSLSICWQHLTFIYEL